MMKNQFFERTWRESDGRYGASSTDDEAVLTGLGLKGGCAPRSPAIATPARIFGERLISRLTMRSGLSFELDERSV
jgi:hypothetical protein